MSLDISRIIKHKKLLFPPGWQLLLKESMASFNPMEGYKKILA